jgi:hypothetical protein
MLFDALMPLHPAPSGKIAPQSANRRIFQFNFTEVSL